VIRNSGNALILHRDAPHKSIAASDVAGRQCRACRETSRHRRCEFSKVSSRVPFTHWLGSFNVKSHAQSARQAPSHQPVARVKSSRHPSSCVGRCIGRLRSGLVESRPAGAHAGEVRDRRRLQDILRATSSEALPEHDFASKVLLEGLPPGQDIFYRVRFEDIAERECRERPVSASEVSSGAAYFNHGMGIRPNLTKRNNEVRFFSMSHCVCYCDQDFQGEAER
jgi:hypothetical protein